MEGMQAAVSGLDLVLDHSDIYNYSGGMDPRRKPYKSWRKKYRKLKLQFDAKMKESDEMFKQEHRAVEVVRRLQESNHQLLEMLADLHWLDNDRQVLDMIERGNLVADKVEHIVTDTVQAVENHARGNTSFDEFKWNLVRNACVSLEDVPAVELRAICLDDEDMTPINYMKPSHEDEYLATLDASLDNQLPPAPSSTAPKLSDKELSIRNPSSVYNWLRRHQPHVLSAQGANGGGGGGGEGDDFSEKFGVKPSKGAGPRSKKKALTVKAEDAPTPRSEIAGTGTDAGDDELAFAGDTYQGGSARGKKRSEDQSYRPKGGASVRKNRKRKALEGPDGEAKKRKFELE